MAEIKLTKNQLRSEQKKLDQLQKYLPTLQLKKALLQLEVQEARVEAIKHSEVYQQEKAILASESALITHSFPIDPKEAIRVVEKQKSYENIAGVEVPRLDTLRFATLDYSLADTPVWLDAFILRMRAVAEARERASVAVEKREALEKELRDVSIRVNLFEKILIPRAKENIKKIQIFLSDQQLAAICQAKVAKKKIVACRDAKKVGG